MGCGGSKSTSSQPASAPLLGDKSELAGTGAQNTHKQNPASGALAGTNAQKTHGQKPISGPYVSLRTIEITIKKTSKNNRIGLNGAPSKNFWSVLDVQDGLVKQWNEQHPNLAVEEGDIIVACNGVQGDGEMICEAMKNDMDLRLTVAKNANAALERSAPPEKHEDVSTTADGFPAEDSSDAGFERQTTLDDSGVRDTPTGGMKETLEADTTDTHSEPNIEDAPRLKDPDQTAQDAIASIVLMDQLMDEQAVPEDDVVEPARKDDRRWVCCTGSKACT